LGTNSSASFAICVHTSRALWLRRHASPAFSEDVVEVDVRKQRRNHRALARPLFLHRNDPVLEDAGPQPFLDEPDDAPITDPVLQEADDP
jgi:hypothetical protein